MAGHKVDERYSRYPMTFSDAIAALFRPKPKRPAALNPSVVLNISVSEAPGQNVINIADAASQAQDSGVAPADRA